MPHMQWVCVTAESPKLRELDAYNGQKPCLTFALEEDVFFVILDSRQTYLLIALEGGIIYLPGLKR